MSRSSLQSVGSTELINTYLDALLHRKIVTAGDIHPRYETLWREIDRISRHGKRLRPKMVMIAYSAFGGSDMSRIVPAAAACELLHISMLIHDDIIDRDLYRHGEPTIQGAYETRYAGEVQSNDERGHNALAAALLAGDLLLSEARALMTKVEVDDAYARHAGYLFDQSVFEVAGGELLDVESAGAPRGSVDALTVMTYKTASYSFIGPLMIGAALAGASQSHQSSLRSFARSLGVAYQLADDILGVFGTTATTGKSNTGDIHEGKATYMIERFYALADASDTAQFEAIYGNRDADDAACDTIRELLRTSGALAETERSVKQYADRAKETLNMLPFNEDAHRSFTELIALSTERSS